MLMEWLHSNKMGQLVVFCNGWGMDRNPIAHLKAINFDVLMLYDYRTLDLPSHFLDELKAYHTVHLVGWSMGVWAGQSLFQEMRDRFVRKIAINGTLCPIDDRFGIPRKIFYDTLEVFDLSTRMKFYKRMCRERTNYKFFLSNKPGRDLASQKEELELLAERVGCAGSEGAIFDEIVISDADWVIPTENQKKFWKGFSVRNLQGFHYPFLSWQSWDHLLDWLRP